ncbi:hypothetical protein [Hydromonas duriensis]|uniref:Uncharacterized protein n=1 Tax=Hydromonas duriensis TaxID=1527608 RepID=A0A4R6Y0G0_9BURK|nr:hypothetical protein [Hydromonas duriensis]TDR28832.1 hypothetical protein DFR44_1332 [Hydromonas duriensis]
MTQAEAAKQQQLERRRQQMWQKILAKVDERDGHCLSEPHEYTNTKSKIWVQCSQGHTFATNWYNLYTGGWCPSCGRNSIRMYTIVDLQNYARTQGGQCLSPKYTNINALYDWQCKRGHRFKAIWWGIYEVWCPYCIEAPDPRARDKFLDSLTQSGQAAHKRKSERAS